MDIDEKLRTVLEAVNGALILDILNMAAYFAPENIRICTFWPVITDKSELQKAILLLDRLELVHCSNDGISFLLPSSTGALLRERLKANSTEEAFLEKTMSVLARSKVLECPHLISVYQYAKLYPALYSKMHKLPGNVVFAMVRDGKHQEAIEFGMECVHLLKTSLGSAHMTILDVQSALGNVLMRKGLRQAAVKLLTDVYEKKCRTMDDEKETQSALDVLASAVFAGPLPMPILLQKEIELRLIVFKGRRVIENLDEPKVKKCVHYARALVPFGLSSVAVGLLEEVITWRRIRYGLSDDCTYDVMQLNAKFMAVEFARYEEPMAYLQIVFLRQVGCFGEMHEKTLHVQSDIAHVLLLHPNYQNLNEALQILQKIETKAKQVVGEKDLLFLEAKIGIVMVYLSRRDYDKALELNTELHEKLVTAFGLISEKCFECKNITGLILTEMNRPQEALKVYESLLEEYEYSVAPLDKIGEVRRKIHSLRSQLRSFDASPGSLHSFAKEGDLGNVLSLIPTGVSLDVMDANGMTPLHFASAFGRVEVAKVLIERGARHDSKATCGVATPLQLAKGNEMMALLEEVNSFFDAAKRGCTDDVIELFSKETCVFGAKDHQGCTPLHWAALHGHLGVVRLLLELGLDPADVSVKGNSPLHIAASKGHERIAEILLRGKSTSLLDGKTFAGGNTPLHAAAEKGHEGMVRLLLAHGAVCTAKNKAGKTPMQLVSEQHYGCKVLLCFIEGLFRDVLKGDLEAVYSVLSFRGDADILALSRARNDEHRTLVQVAFQQKHFEMAKILVSRLKYRV